MDYRKLLISLLLALAPHLANAEILLFNSSNEYRGCLDCSRFDSNSICNRFGTYGNRFNSESIWNRFGAGNRFDSESPWGRFGTGLKMVDREGNFYGYLSISINGERNYRDLFRQLHENYDGDLNAIRDAFCE